MSDDLKARLRDASGKFRSAAKEGAAAYRRDRERRDELRSQLGLNPDVAGELATVEARMKETRDRVDWHRAQAQAARDGYLLADEQDLRDPTFTREHVDLYADALAAGRVRTELE